MSHPYSIFHSTFKRVNHPSERNERVYCESSCIILQDDVDDILRGKMQKIHVIILSNTRLTIIMKKQQLTGLIF